MGATKQPETSSADATHAANLEGEAYLLAKKGVTHVQITIVEADLSQQHLYNPDPKVHAQTVSTEQNPKSDDNNSYNEWEAFCTETWGMENEGTIPDANACVHLESTEQEDLMNVKEDWVYKLEEGTARENASVKEDRDPCIKLQEPGVSYLATQEDAESLTLSSSPPITLETARMQCSPAINTGTPAIPEPEDCGMDLELQPHDTLTNKAVEPHDHLPEQIRASIKPGETSESFRGKQTQCAISQTGLISTRALEGMTLIREVHGRPPNLPDPLMQGSTVWEPEFDIPKARVHVHQTQRPVLNEGVHMCPDLWPSLTVVIVDLDTYFRSASQLKGEQNIHIPCVGSELHAALSAPHISSFSPLPPVPLPSDTLMHKNLLEEGTATKQHTTDDRHLEPWKLPDTQAEDLHESGGVSASDDSPILLWGLGDPDPFGLAGVAENTDVEDVKLSHVDAYERGGVLPVAGAAPALAKGTISVEPTGEAERAIIAKSEALVPWAQGMAKCKVERPW